MQSYIIQDHTSFIAEVSKSVAVEVRPSEQWLSGMPCTWASPQQVTHNIRILCLGCTAWAGDIAIGGALQLAGDSRGEGYLRLHSPQGNFLQPCEFSGTLMAYRGHSYQLVPAFFTEICNLKCMITYPLILIIGCAV